MINFHQYLAIFLLYHILLGFAYTAHYNQTLDESYVTSKLNSFSSDLSDSSNSFSSASYSASDTDFDRTAGNTFEISSSATTALTKIGIYLVPGFFIGNVGSGSVATILRFIFYPLDILFKVYFIILLWDKWKNRGASVS